MDGVVAANVTRVGHDVGQGKARKFMFYHGRWQPRRASVLSASVARPSIDGLPHRWAVSQTMENILC